MRLRHGLWVLLPMLLVVFESLAAAEPPAAPTEPRPAATAEPPPVAATEPLPAPVPEPPLAPAAAPLPAPPPAPARELPPLALPRVSPGTLAFDESFSVRLPSLSLQSTNTNASPSMTGTAYSNDLASLLVGGLGGLGGLGSAALQELALSGGYQPSFGGRCYGGASTDTPCVAFQFSLSGTYHRSFEAIRFAYQIDASLGLSPDVRSGMKSSLDDHRVTTFGLDLSPSLSGEIRWFPAGPAADMFLFLRQSASDYLTYGLNDGNEYWRNSVASRTAVGLGWGRVLPVGTPTRLRKLVRHLAARGALSGEVTSEVGDEILRHWYALRNEVGWYAHVAYLEQVLRRHGLLARPLDLEEGYVTAAILQDAMLNNRYQGWRADASVEFSEAAVQVKDLPGSSLTGLPYHQERLAVDVTGHWVNRVGLDDQVEMRAVLHIAPDTLDEPFPWLVFVAQPQFEKYFYSKHQDPIGSLTVGVRFLLATAWGTYVKPTSSYRPGLTEGAAFHHPLLGTTSLTVQGGHLTAELGASLQYDRTLSRGSSFWAGFGGGLMKLPDQDTGYYIGLNAGITFGVAKGSFARY